MAPEVCLQKINFKRIIKNQFETNRKEINLKLIVTFFLKKKVISRKNYGTEVDIWSLAVLLIEMIESEPPLFDLPPLQAMRRIRDPPPPKLKNPERVSPRLLDFLEKMLVMNPLERATAFELLEHPFLQLAGPPSVLIPLMKSVRFQQQNQQN